MKTPYKILPVYLIAALPLLFASCEKSINVNVPPYAHELVVNCNADAYQSLYIDILRSASIAEKKGSPDLVIRDATVKLYIDGAFSETLTYDPTRGYMSAHAAMPGKQYTLRVSEASYTDVEATAAVPADVLISNVVFTPNARKDQDGNEQDAVTITFTDPPAAGDYYLVRVNGVQDPNAPYGGGNSFCVNSNDGSVETNTTELVDANTCLDNNAVFIRDALFNGRAKELKLYVVNNTIAPVFNGTDSLFATVELLHVTEAYFRYMKSDKVAQDANGNPFAEPVNVYTNVTNGLGIFSAINRDIKQIR